MDWELIAKCFGGLLVLLGGYTYINDKKYFEGRIDALSKKIDQLQSAKRR